MCLIIRRAKPFKKDTFLSFVLVAGISIILTPEYWKVLPVRNKTIEFSVKFLVIDSIVKIALSAALSFFTIVFFSYSNKLFFVHVCINYFKK